MLGTFFMYKCGGFLGTGYGTLYQGPPYEAMLSLTVNRTVSALEAVWPMGLPEVECIFALFYTRHSGVLGARHCGTLDEVSC